MKYLSLFSGIGGFELGIKQAYETKNNNGLESEQWTEKQSLRHKSDKPDSSSSLGNGWGESPTCIGFSEIDKYATQVYSKHFNHKNYGDITKINESTLPDFDLLVGGFPCQSFSIAGKRGGFNDTRGTLFFDVARILKEKQPRLCVLENVKGLLSHEQGATFRTIISTLDELGYDCQWQVLNSKNFGVPQNRERVFIIGHLRGTSRPEVFPIGQNDKENTESREVCTSATVSTRTGSTAGGQQFIKVVGTLLEDAKIRRLTPKECERLQGFPNDWTKYGQIGGNINDNGIGTLHPISDTQRYKMCGNAVTVNVIKEIFKNLIQ